MRSSHPYPPPVLAHTVAQADIVPWHNQYQQPVDESSPLLPYLRVHRAPPYRFFPIDNLLLHSSGLPLSETIVSPWRNPVRYRGCADTRAQD